MVRRKPAKHFLIAGKLIALSIADFFTAFFTLPVGYIPPAIAMPKFPQRTLRLLLVDSVKFQRPAGRLLTPGTVHTTLISHQQAPSLAQGTAELPPLAFDAFLVHFGNFHLFPGAICTPAHIG